MSDHVWYSQGSYNLKMKLVDRKNQELALIGFDFIWFYKRNMIECSHLSSAIFFNTSVLVENYFTGKFLKQESFRVSGLIFCLGIE